MANVNINTTELRALLDLTPADQNIMLVGNHGIGKSEILTEYFSEKGMTVVPLFLGQMSDPGDLIGIPNTTTPPARRSSCRRTGSRWTASPSSSSWTS